MYNRDWLDSFPYFDRNPIDKEVKAFDNVKSDLLNENIRPLIESDIERCK